MTGDIRTVISFEDFRNERRLVYLDLGKVVALSCKRKATAEGQPRSGYLPVYADETIEAAAKAMKELTLTDKEQEFIANMKDRAKRYGESFGMTENQLQWFRSIVGRLDNAVQA